MGMRSLNGESDRKGKMKEKLRLAVFGHKGGRRGGGGDWGESRPPPWGGRGGLL